MLNKTIIINIQNPNNKECMVKVSKNMCVKQFIKFMFLIFSGVIIMTTFGCGLSLDERSSESMKTFTEGNLMIAQKHAKGWAKLAPEDPAPKLLLSIIDYFNGDFESCSRYRDQCFASNHDNFSFISRIEKARKENPSSPWVELASAIIKDGTGHGSEAVERYERAIELGIPHDKINATLEIARFLNNGGVFQREVVLKPSKVWRPAEGAQGNVLPIDNESVVVGTVKAKLGSLTFTTDVTGHVLLKSKKDDGETVGWGVTATSGSIPFAFSEYKQMTVDHLPCFALQSFDVSQLDFHGRFVLAKILKEHNHRVVIPIQIHSSSEKYSQIVTPDRLELNGRMYRTGGGSAGFVIGGNGQASTFGSDNLRILIDSSSEIQGSFGVISNL